MNNVYASTAGKDQQNQLSQLPDSSPIEDGLLRWQEVAFHFKLVACHASNLSHLLCQRARRAPHLRFECEYLAWKMRSCCRNSLAVCQVIRARPRQMRADGLELLPLRASVKRSLRGCITNLRTFDSFCRALPHEPGMDQISWSLVQYENSSHKIITRAGGGPLLRVLYRTETCIYSAIHNVSKATWGRWGDRLMRFYETERDESDGEKDFAYDESVMSCTGIEIYPGVYGAFSIRNVPGGKAEKLFVADQHTPRDVEAEVSKFHTELAKLSSLNGQLTIARSSPQSSASKTVWMESLGHGKIEIPKIQPLHGTLLVSLNSGRPKKKDASLSGNKLILRRPNGGDLSEETTIPSSNMLLVTQRSGGTSITTLTVFWRSPEDIKSPTGLEAFKVESAEIFLDDVELLKTWQLGLGRFEQLAAEATQTIEEEPKPSF